MWELALSLASKALPLLTGPVSQFVTGININQVLSNVFSALTTLVGFVKKHWQLCLFILLAAGNVAGFSGWSHTAQELKTERAAHQADIKSYKDAQAKADKAARDQEQNIIKESKVRANAADNSYRDLLSKYNASLMRYRANQSGSVSTGGHQEDNSASPASESTDGPSGNTGLYISLTDAQKCATNTARLVIAHDWALGLAKDTP